MGYFPRKNELWELSFQSNRRSGIALILLNACGGRRERRDDGGAFSRAREKAIESKKVVTKTTRMHSVSQSRANARYGRARD